jgi:hypothetical protein
MSLKKEPIKRLPAFYLVRKYDPFTFVEKCTEHDEPVGDRPFRDVLEGFLNPKHIFAEAPACPFIRDPVCGNNKFIPPRKEPDARRAFLIKIGIQHIGPADKGEIFYRADSSMKTQIIDHKKILSQE